MNDILVEAKRLSKHFFVLKTRETALRILKALITRQTIRREFWALRDISFEIKKSDKLAVIGKNGSGKTTLVRILSGIYDKTSGYLRIAGNPKALFKFNVGFNQYLSVMDNIYLFGAIHGIREDVLKNNIDKILEMTGLYDVRFSMVKELSMGQHQRLALSIFFQNDSNFLIFDENMTFIDKGFAQTCDLYFNSLFSSDKTVILVSHDMEFLKRYCKTAIWLDKGRIRAQGNIEYVVREYEQV